MNSPPSEEDLQRVAAGDPAATWEFYEQFILPVLKFLHRFHRLTDEDREELANDALLTAMKSLERYDRSTKIISWIFGIAKNKAWTRLRDEATRLEREGRQSPEGRKKTEVKSGRYETEGGAGGVAVQTTPQVRYASEFLQERMRQAEAWLEEQSPEDQIIARHFSDQVPYHQLAEELSEYAGREVKEATARQRGRRFAEKARKRFPEFM
jgi:RNA polymerase sigma factor (sigma-70 family)